ncbi:unnamed protein product [Cylicocyclus nassatus]|uniref:NADP-dependent oxidoreductase domain-containing protein n=1 Tax=Cylicocyclus nassatus TaxID=53992 RepID=A0AA36GX44_CYLNA|nr:unnamed protein product [Cylicocyclus nassatus]
MVAADVAGGTKELADGNRIPLIGLGTAENRDQEGISTAVEAALKAGYRLIDTAEHYQNEEELGIALAENLPKFGLKREDIFITTKVQIMNGKVADWAEFSIKQSLDKLRTDYVDMLLIHAPRDRDTGSDDDLETNKKGRKELWQKMEEFKERGIVKSIGVSNYEVYHLMELFEYAKQRPVMNQLEFTPYITRPILKHFCESNNIFVQAFSSQLWDNKEILVEDPVMKLSEKYKVSPHILLYAFGLNSGVGIVPRSGNPAHIEDNLFKEGISTAIEAALKAGYRMIDTAEYYQNEEELGIAIAENLPRLGLKREDIFITSKVQIKNGKVSDWAEFSVRQSLDKLRTDYLDMLLVHFPRDRDTGKNDEYELNKKGRKELWQKMEEFKERGIVKSIGVSNYEVYHLIELFEYAKHRPVMNQLEFTPYFTRPTLKHFCEMNNIFMQAFSSQLWGNKEVLVEDAVQKLAEKFNVTPQVLLYAFGVNSGCGIVPRSGNPKHIEDNIRQVPTIKMSDEELESLNELDRNASLCPGVPSWRCL